MKNKRRGWDIGGSGHNWPPGAGDSGAWPSVSPLSSPRPWPETAPPWATYRLLSKSSCSCFRLVAAKVLGASGKLKAYSFAIKKFYFCRCADPVGRKVAPGQREREGGKQDTQHCHLLTVTHIEPHPHIDSWQSMPWLSRALYSSQQVDRLTPSLNLIMRSTPPANPVNLFWSKMACTGVAHIVLHVSCWTRTSGGYFWSSKVRFRGILAQNTP